MKKILSVSLGSESRDHTTRHTFLGEGCEFSGKGINAGSGESAGHVPGVRRGGGCLRRGRPGILPGRRKATLLFPGGQTHRAAIKLSKVGDGNGVKGLLVQRAFAALETHLKRGRQNPQRYESPQNQRSRPLCDGRCPGEGRLRPGLWRPDVLARPADPGPEAVDRAPDGRGFAAGHHPAAFQAVLPAWLSAGQGT